MKKKKVLLIICFIIVLVHVAGNCIEEYERRNYHPRVHEVYYGEVMSYEKVGEQIKILLDRRNSSQYFEFITDEMTIEPSRDRIEEKMRNQEIGILVKIDTEYNKGTLENEPYREYPKSKENEPYGVYPILSFIEVEE